MAITMGICRRAPYAKACRRLSSEGPPVLHAGVDHQAHQFSRFTVIDVEGKVGFENCPRSTTTGRLRLRSNVTVNHLERFWAELKKSMPRHLSYADYVADPWTWLMCASWHARGFGDPFLRLSRTFACQDEFAEAIDESASDGSAGGAPSDAESGSE